MRVDDKSRYSVIIKLVVALQEEKFQKKKEIMA